MSANPRQINPEYWPGWAALILALGGWGSYKFYRQGYTDGAIWNAVIWLSIVGFWTIVWFIGMPDWRRRKREREKRERERLWP
jgi:hypothetical protein